MIIDSFTPVSATLGGVLIGASASAMLYFSGRIAGISGIFGGMLKPNAGDVLWRIAFVAGLIAGGGVLALAMPAAFDVPAGRSLGAVAIAGLLVGFGTRMGNGCTSGHGICGLTRFSRRSAVAVATFMGAGVLTASLLGALVGGVL